MTRHDRMTDAEKQADADARVEAWFAQRGEDIDDIDPVRAAQTARLLDTESAGVVGT
jgi:hypothetical protein